MAKIKEIDQTKIRFCSLIYSFSYSIIKYKPKSRRVTEVMADALIESGGSGGGGSVSLQQQPPPLQSSSQSQSQSIGGGSGSSGISHNSMNPIIPIISADIQMDNNPLPRPPTSSVDDSVLMKDIDEPESKRKKFDNTVAGTSGAPCEKLELRLGGILCCAVCLDLPKTAMYQVGSYF